MFAMVPAMSKTAEITSYKQRQYTPATIEQVRYDVLSNEGDKNLTKLMKKSKPSAGEL
jgi:hypothetical protein